jgi:large subunit ribosomal protein L23Ae
VARGAEAKKAVKAQPAKGNAPAAPQPKGQRQSRRIRTSPVFHRPKTLALPRNPKYLRKSKPATNKFDKFTIIKHPLCTWRARGRRCFRNGATREARSC